MAGQSQIAVPDVYRTLAFGSISGSYAVVGTPFLHLMRVFRITNNSDGDMAFSVDGVNNNFFVPAGSFVLYDLCTNREVATSLYLPYGTQFYVKSISSPSKGAVYVEGIYGQGE